MDVWVLLSYLSYITAMALGDSFDPCFFALVAGIFISATAVNYKYAIRAGAVFTVFVYIGYFIMGLIAKTLIQLASIPIEYLGVFLILYGGITLTASLLKKESSTTQRDQFVCREDDIPCRIASKLDLEHYATKGLIVVGFMGLLSSFTILGCSAGLFFQYIIWTETIHLDLSAFILLTLYYVAVFVSPIVILLLSLAGLLRLKNIHSTIIKHGRVVKVLGSLVMITVGLILVTGIYH